MLEMEALLLELLQHRAVLPEFARDPSYAERDELLLRKPLGLLNNALDERRHSAEDNSTVADLKRGEYPCAANWGAWDYRPIRTWRGGWSTCLAKPAYGRVRDRTKSK